MLLLNAKYRPQEIEKVEIKTEHECPDDLLSGEDLTGETSACDYTAFDLHQDEDQNVSEQNVDNDELSMLLLKSREKQSIQLIDVILFILYAAIRMSKAMHVEKNQEYESAVNNKRKMATAKKELPVDERHYTAQELEMESKTAEYFHMNCDLCLHQFSCWNDARTHYLDRHNILKPFLRCCNRKFFLRSRIIEHVTWHVDPSSFQYVYF